MLAVSRRPVPSAEYRVPSTQDPVLGTRYSVLGTQCPRALTAFLVLLALCHACPAADDDEPPVKYRPKHFNGAVGTFRVSAAADPVKVQAEDPLTYTVRVAADQVKQPPQRPPLADFPGFADGFYVEDVGPPEGTRPDKQTWEFAYRLKPKSTVIGSVPSFPFASYRPGVGYMTVYVPEIPITVTPRETLPDLPPAKPITGPDAAFVLADGDVLRRADDRLPGLPVLILALLAPPLAGVAWYFAWRRLYPDAARLVRRRRSRAAQEALKALRDTDPRGADDQARRTAAAVADYLRHRLELPMTEPTPAEAEAHLRDRGMSEELARETADFLRTCAAARFDPEPPPRADLAEVATKIVLALEAETWSE